MPVGDVLVGDAGGHIEHDDAALAVDVVSITQTTKLLLTSRVPDVELDLTEVLYALLALSRWQLPACTRGAVLTVVKPRG